MGCAALRCVALCAALRCAALDRRRCLSDRTALTAAQSVCLCCEFDRFILRTHIHCAQAPARLNEATWISEMASATPAAATAAAGSASSSQQPASVPSFQLTGHSKPVLCLHAAGDKSAHPHLLLSGSEVSHATHAGRPTAAALRDALTLSHADARALDC